MKVSGLFALLLVVGATMMFFNILGGMYILSFITTCCYPFCFIWENCL